jgi:endonuclease YncB( thermonuclease family)
LETWKIRLVDGDTFWYGGERIRVRGYDAPERSESGGVEAMQRLDNLLHEGQVVIIPRATDVYGRTVADVYVDTRNVADVMTAEGYVKPGRPPRN